MITKMLNLGFGTYLLGLIVRGESWDFPGHPVVRNRPSSAETWDQPLVGELSLHASGRLRPWAAAIERPSSGTCAPQRRPGAAKLFIYFIF